MFGPEEESTVPMKPGDRCECGGTVCEYGYCDTCANGLADTGDSLISRDWAEIYSALEMVWQLIEDDELDTPELSENWRRHIRSIMAKIGRDGQDMVL